MRIEDSIRAWLSESMKETPSQEPKSDLKSVISMRTGGHALKKVDNDDVENALNNMSVRNAVNYLLSKSPIGLKNMQDIGDLSRLGYVDSGIRAYHLGAPISFTSADGGTITIYDGRGPKKLGEDQRKIVYENGKYRQEFFYDDDGTLTNGKITIKDETAGFTEQQFTFRIENNKIVE